MSEREPRKVSTARNQEVDPLQLEELLTASPEACWRAWIQAIANNPDYNLRGIMDHLQLHVGKHMPNHDAPKERWQAWLAGTYNLLAILAGMTGSITPYSLGNELLYRKWRKEPDDHMPPPIKVENIPKVTAAPPVRDYRDDDLS